MSPEVQRTIEDGVLSKIAFTLRFLPCELPSRKKDSELFFFLRSIPYALVGTLALLIAAGISPGLRQLPLIWIANLRSLSGLFEKGLCLLLSLVALWFGAFSVGVLIIEKSRPVYRQHIVRRVERVVRSVSRLAGRLYSQKAS